MSQRDGGRVVAIRPAWSFEARGVVWRVAPSGEGLLLVEERDLERKVVRFIALDAATGTIRWDRESFGDPWWIGVLGVADGVLLLHGFAAPDMPLPRGLIAVRMASGDVLWRWDDLEQMEFRGGALAAVRRDGGRERALTVDLHTGEEGDGSRVMDPLSTRGDDAVRFPLPLGEDDALLPALDQYRRDAELAIPIEALQQGNLTVFAVHELTRDPAGLPPTVTSTVRVVNTDGCVVFEQIIARDVQGGIPDSFLLVQDVLYLLVDRRRLVAVCLAPSAL